MSSAPVDAMAFEATDPLEDGLRILARIIARDILTKRAIVNGTQTVEKHMNDNNAETK
ncbi:MAG: hypothetical protein JW800_02565 [Candidatus Omnitrophica bacterium]|nr:hypothetical protein [Candidatus Omnitrophota bacterium]